MEDLREKSLLCSNNHFAGLTTKDDVLDDDTANTIVELIATHMANISLSVFLQATATNDENKAIFNTLMQQVATNKVQHTQEHNHMFQQFAMMLTAPPVAQQFVGQQAGWLQAATQCNFIPCAIPNFAPTQQWGQPPGGRRCTHKKERAQNKKKSHVVFSKPEFGDLKTHPDG